MIISDAYPYFFCKVLEVCRSHLNRVPKVTTVHLVLSIQTSTHVQLGPGPTRPTLQPQQNAMCVLGVPTAWQRLRGLLHFVQLDIIALQVMYIWPTLATLAAIIEKVLEQFCGSY